MGYHHFQSGTQAGDIHLLDIEATYNPPLAEKEKQRYDEDARRRGQSAHDHGRLVKVAYDLNNIQSSVFGSPMKKSKNQRLFQSHTHAKPSERRHSNNRFYDEPAKMQLHNTKSTSVLLKN